MCYYITLLIMTRENNSSRKKSDVYAVQESEDLSLLTSHPVRAAALPTGRYGRNVTDFTFDEILVPAMEWMGPRLNRVFLNPVPWSREMCKHFESWRLLTSSLVPVWTAGHLQYGVQPCYLVGWGLCGWARSIRLPQRWKGEAAPVCHPTCWELEGAQTWQALVKQDGKATLRSPQHNTCSVTKAKL